MSGVIAVTGATGFVGRRLLPLLAAEGWRVRALVRRPAPDLAAQGVEPVPGSLAEPERLRTLVRDAAAIVHLAGAINAPTPAGFTAANVAGTARLAAAAALTGRCPRFLHVSSLAARAPELSDYARSKGQAEAEVMRHGHALALTILRPPAIYGPGDRATLPLFRQLARGRILVPRGAGRFSLLFVDDLARLLAHLLRLEPGGHAPIEPDDGTPGGYSWSELAAIATHATGRLVRTLPVPQGLLWLPAATLEAYGRLRARPPLLSRGKLRELYHPDWVSRGTEPQALAGWTADTRFETGCGVTLGWYGRHGWL